MKSSIQFKKADIESAANVLEILSSEDLKMLTDNAIKRAVQIQKTLVEAIDNFKKRSEKVQESLWSIIKRAGEIMLSPLLNDNIESNSHLKKRQLFREASELHEESFGAWKIMLDMDLKMQHDIFPLCCQLEHWMMGTDKATKKDLKERITVATKDITKNSLGMVPILGNILAAVDVVKTLKDFTTTCVSMDDAIYRIRRLLSGLYAIQFFDEGGLSTIVSYLDERKKVFVEADETIDALSEWLQKVELRYKEITEPAGQ